MMTTHFIFNDNRGQIEPVEVDFPDAPPVAIPIVGDQVILAGAIRKIKERTFHFHPNEIIISFNTD